MDDLKYGDVLKWASTKMPDTTTFMYIGPPSKIYPGGAEIGQVVAIVAYDGSPTGKVDDRYLEYFKKVDDATVNTIFGKYGKGSLIDSRERQASHTK